MAVIAVDVVDRTQFGELRLVLHQALVRSWRVFAVLVQYQVHVLLRERVVRVGEVIVLVRFAAVRRVVHQVVGDVDLVVRQIGPVRRGCRAGCRVLEMHRTVFVVQLHWQYPVH